MTDPTTHPESGGTGKTRLALLALFVGLVVATIWVGAREYLSWKNNRLASEILSHAQKGDLDVARTALSALDLRWIAPDFAERCQLAVWRITDPGAALGLIEKKIDASTAQTRDLQLGTEMALRLDDPTRAEKILIRLRAVAPSGVETMYLGGWYALERGDFRTAARDIQAALALLPGHRGASLLRARLMAESDSYLERVGGRSDLRNIADGNDLLSLDARVALAAGRRTVDTRGEREEAYRAILDHPLAKAAYVLKRENVLKPLLVMGDGLAPDVLMPLAENLIAIRPDDPAALASYVLIAQQNGRNADAAKILAKLKKVDAGGENTRLLEARQLLLEGDPARALAMVSQFSAAQAKSSQTLTFLASFISSKGKVPEDLQRRAAELALAGPPDNYPLWLAVRGRLAELSPEHRDALVAEVVASATGDHALPAAEWLLALTRAKEAVALARPLADKGDARAATLAIEGMIAQKEFAEAETMARSLDLGAVDRALMNARLAVAQQKLPRAETDWRVGFDDAQRRDDSLAILRLAVGAGRIGLPRCAEEAFARVADLIEDGSLVCDAGEVGVWLEACLRQRHSHEAYRAAQCLAAKPDGEQAGRYWAAYLGLLLNENVLEEKDVARQLYDQTPAETQFRAVFAFAQLRTGQTAGALQTVHDQIKPGESDRLPYQIRVVLTAVCAANGLTEDADHWRKSLDGAKLLPEEQVLTEDSGRPAIANN